MSKIILKKSSVVDKIPVTGDLDYGELAINYADGKLFYKNSSNTIQQLSSGTLSGLSGVSISNPSSEQILKYNGTNWINSANLPSNIGGGATNKIVYQTASSTTGFIDAPSTADTYLKWTGSAFGWSTVSGGFNGGTVTGAVSITDSTTSTSTTTGALIVTGGVGVSGSIYAPTYYLSGGSSLSTASIVFVIDGGGTAITTGIKGDIAVPFNCTINSWRLLADVSGSIVVDIWKDTYANFAPTIADTITGSALPGITSSTKNESSTLTGWTTALTAGDILRFNVNSASTITRVTLSLQVTKT